MPLKRKNPTGIPPTNLFIINWAFTANCVIIFLPPIGIAFSLRNASAHAMTQISDMWSDHILKPE